jgi:hypothetical protein
MSPGPSPALPPEAVAALHQGGVIEAIKIVRAVNGLQLKDAKDAVDAYVRSQPALRLAIEARQKEARGALVKWLLIVAGMIALAYAMRVFS